MPADDQDSLPMSLGQYLNQAERLFPDLDDEGDNSQDAI